MTCVWWLDRADSNVEIERIEIVDQHFHIRTAPTRLGSHTQIVHHLLRFLMQVATQVSYSLRIFTLVTTLRDSASKFPIPQPATRLTQNVYLSV